ncbi:MAG: hypothetical protein M1829_003294 [Trizodia sp. TS-e1964]|nr:MAG: hypothetical protein M1829_003294 [Trizodia sp. TS-e1964]
MFWRFGGYANLSTIDTLLDKSDITLEELLEEPDLLQELKQHNTKLIEYLRDERVLSRLLGYTVAPNVYLSELDESYEKPNVREVSAEDPATSGRKGKLRSDPVNLGELEQQERNRQKYAYISYEVLTSDTYSLQEAMLESPELLRQFWKFLASPAPLDAVQASYFCKVNEMLLDKLTERMLGLFKTFEGAVANILQHVECPMVMDLLLKIISLEKVEGGQGIVDWLHSQNLIPILLSYLAPLHASPTQTSAGDFLKAIITISANASQNEQACIGPNDLTRQLVSETCIRNMITNMLHGGNPLTVGVAIVIEVIRKNNSDYDPDVGGIDSAPSSRDPIYLGTLLRMFAEYVPEFMALILSPNHTISNGGDTQIVKRRELNAAFGEKIEPLGFDRFKTCELMAELLHCSNMGLLNERGSERFVKERDQERERLKNSGTEFGEDESISFPNGDSLSIIGSRSPEDIRKLEVQNAGEDDGFEDVAVSGALNDEVRDDFDEKSEIEDEPQDDEEAHEKTEDEDFADDAFLSPRSSAYSHSTSLGSDFGLGSCSNIATDGDSTPTSPLSRSLSSQTIEIDSVLMTSPPRQPASSEDDEIPQAPQTPTKKKESDGPTIKPIQPAPQPELSSQQVATETLSPHPEDQPEPLFAKRPTSTSESSDSEIGPYSQHNDAKWPAIDSNHADEGDSTHSYRSALMMDHEIGYESNIETDVDGSPVVGDFLKMMFVENRVVPTILDFFFRFPWNNFLHNVVYDVVQQVFNGPMDRGYNRTLAINLFEVGKITERIVEGQRKSDEVQEKTNMRLGYMGHLTLIAEEVVKFTERHPAATLSENIQKMMSDPVWIYYVEHTLAETRERDNAILGGVRPEISLAPRQAVLNTVSAAHGFSNGTSAVLANAGLIPGGPSGFDALDTGNGGHLSSGGYSISGAPLLSGFGSSSDEEDEEMDDDRDEDGGRGIHSGSDQQNFSSFLTSTLSSLNYPSLNTVGAAASSSSQSEHSPPDAPPPPPPLNIPPSRARRQLAARLALHSRQKEEEATRKKPDKDGLGHGVVFSLGPDEDDDLDNGGDEVRGLRGGGLEDGIKGDSQNLSSSSSSSSDDDLTDLSLTTPTNNLFPATHTSSSATATLPLDIPIKSNTTIRTRPRPYRPSIRSALSRSLNKADSTESSEDEDEDQDEDENEDEDIDDHEDDEELRTTRLPTSVRRRELEEDDHIEIDVGDVYDTEDLVQVHKPFSVTLPQFNAIRGARSVSGAGKGNGVARGDKPSMWL